jgi:lipopolysaccharide/colanic/teichoic acid biosynthesis glycosyltransferase
VVDASIALTALLLLLPWLLAIAFAIKLDSDGPVLFRQCRVGYDRRRRRVREFTIYKFRTMRQDADGAVHRAHMRDIIHNKVAPSAHRPSLKMTNDRRVTRVGRILRATSLDELPQLINVLLGNMSLVGPRPALPYEVELYEEWHRRRLQAPPGITGWWQVMGRNRVSFDDMVRMDLYYVEHRSLSLDFKILFLTPRAVLSGKGAG